MKGNHAMKHIGLVTASPSEFLIHQRFGRTRILGRGRAAWLLPWIDRYCLIPSSTHSVSFCADQITAENQGVEISGFAIWNVEVPERAAEAVDFTNHAEAINLIGGHLREVVESAIRHQVANLSLEEALRQRGPIIVRLRQELADVADKWGLAITTVEIKTVRIMSGRLFENMQAKFRDTVRLESERSAMATDEAIALERAAVREEAARREMEFQKAQAAREETLRRAAIERESQIEKLRLAEQTSVELAKLGEQLKLTTGRESNRREASAAEHALIELEEALDARRFKLEQHRGENRDALAAIEDGIERRRIESANTRDTALLLVENLPDMLAGLKVADIHLGDPMLVEALATFARSLAGPGHSGGYSNHPARKG